MTYLPLNVNHSITSNLDKYNAQYGFIWPMLKALGHLNRTTAKKKTIHLSNKPRIDLKGPDN